MKQTDEAARGSAKHKAETPKMEVEGEYAYNGFKKNHGGGTNDPNEPDPIRGPVPESREVNTKEPLPCKYADNEILDCFCCLGDQLTSIGRGDLFYAGHLHHSTVEVVNHKFDGSEWIHEVKVWQVGGRTPKIVCEGGRLTCECEDEQNDWAIYESQCTEGEICSPRYGDLKSDLMDPENRDIGLNPWSPMNDITMLGDEIHEACIVRGLFASQKNDRLRSCPSYPAHDGSMETRVALGAMRCENAAAENCGRFYSRIGCEWRLCEQKEMVKKCNAVPRYSKPWFKDEVLKVDEWYFLERYNPNDAEQMFDVFNTNQEGGIDMDEWKSACRTLGLARDDQGVNRCEAMFDDLDFSGNGELEKGDIVLLFRNSRGLWDLGREEVDALLAQAQTAEVTLMTNHNKIKLRSSLAEQSSKPVPRQSNVTKMGSQQASDEKSNRTKFAAGWPPEKPSIKPRALPTARRTTPSKKRNKQ